MNKQKKKKKIKQDQKTPFCCYTFGCGLLFCLVLVLMLGVSTGAAWQAIKTFPKPCFSGQDRLGFTRNTSKEMREEFFGA